MFIKTGKAIIVVVFIVYAVIGPTTAMAASKIVEIFYLPHPPAEAVVKDVESVLKKHDQFKVAKYSFDDPESKKILAKYNLREHMPVIIFIDGQNEFTLGKRKVTFKNFPKGNAFVPMFEGNWSYRDLDGVLSAVEKGK
jgi:hypothetical protein